MVTVQRCYEFSAFDFSVKFRVQTAIFLFLFLNNSYYMSYFSLLKVDLRGIFVINAVFLSARMAHPQRVTRFTLSYSEGLNNKAPNNYIKKGDTIITVSCHIKAPWHSCYCMLLFHIARNIIKSKNIPKDSSRCSIMASNMTQYQGIFVDFWRYVSIFRDMCWFLGIYMSISGDISQFLGISGDRTWFLGK